MIFGRENMNRHEAVLLAAGTFHDRGRVGLLQHAGVDKRAERTGWALLYFIRTEDRPCHPGCGQTLQQGFKEVTAGHGR